MKKNTHYNKYDNKDLKQKFLEEDNFKANIRNLKKDDVKIFIN